MKLLHTTIHTSTVTGLGNHMQHLNYKTLHLVFTHNYAAPQW